VTVKSGLYLLEPRHHDGFKESLLGGKVPVEGADAHARPLGDDVDRNGDSFGGEGLLGGSKNFLVIL
jgi:hypothetical protein